MTLKYHQLDVYQKAFRVAVNLHGFYDAFPKYEQFGGLADQMRRASKGICANLAEGLAKYGVPEQSRFLNMAIGSAEEMQVWLSFCRALHYMREEDVSSFIGEYEQITAMLRGLLERRKKTMRERTQEKVNHG